MSFLFLRFGGLKFLDCFRGSMNSAPWLAKSRLRLITDSSEKLLTVKSACFSSYLQEQKRQPFSTKLLRPRPALAVAKTSEPF
jgi:hypothetical protein